MKKTSSHSLTASALSFMISVAMLAFSPILFAADDSKVISYPAKYKQLDAPTEKVPKYFSMEKIVVNFRGEGKAKFLAIDLKFMSYYPQLVETEMEHLRPILKNDIDRLLRNQTYSQLTTPTGSDELREELMTVARNILEQHRLFPDLLEAVYLERFVMQ